MMYKVHEIVQKWSNVCGASALVAKENNTIYLYTTRPGLFIGFHGCYVDKYRALIKELGFDDVIIKEAYEAIHPKGENFC